MALCLFVSYNVTSCRCSIKIAEWIELVFCTGASFHLSYNVLVGRLGVATCLAWPASRRRSTGRRDGRVLSGAAVWIESARQLRCASECVRRSHCAARHTPTQTRHRTHLSKSIRIHTAIPDTTKQSCLCRSCLAWRCELALSWQ